jgi:succinate dehydrogenase/fumarate reductase flavoprotein subunit
MRKFASGAEIAKDMGIPVDKLQKTLDKYNKGAEAKNDEFTKKFFPSVPFDIKDKFHVSIVTPIVHYCMAGIEVDAEGCVIDKAGKVIPGLYAAGETAGGVHGANRLGGNSLLDCVVFGRVCGDSASRFLLENFSQHGSTNSVSQKYGISIEKAADKFVISIPLVEEAKGLLAKTMTAFRAPKSHSRVATPSHFLGAAMMQSSMMASIMTS